MYNILKIRKSAIEKFSTDNIKNDEPYSVLEDVFVPLFFFHRYQTEATSKLIGGLDYNYAVKGGNQTVVKPVSGAIERIALQALLKTLDVKEIGIPKEKLNLFPPRAIGYSRSRESFNSKLGVAFDAVSAMETASEMTLRFLMHPQRMSRLITHKALNDKQLGLEELIDEVFNKSFKKTHSDAYYAELQYTVNHKVLEQLFALGSGSRQYMQVAAIVHQKLEELKGYLKSAKTSGVQKAYNNVFIQKIESFQKNPKDFKRLNAPKIPDGSPIGTQYQCE